MPLQLHDIKSKVAFCCGSNMFDVGRAITAQSVEHAMVTFDVKSKLTLLKKKNEPFVLEPFEHGMRYTLDQ